MSRASIRRKLHGIRRLVKKADKALRYAIVETYDDEMDPEEIFASLADIPESCDLITVATEQLFSDLESMPSPNDDDDEYDEDEFED